MRCWNCTSTNTAKCGPAGRCRPSSAEPSTGRPGHNGTPHCPARNSMHCWFLLLLLFCTPAFAAPPGPAPPQRILFVGNSLTYVGNLPATFAAMANANGHAVHAAMIVEGGATLDQRVADGSVQRALADYKPAVLVLQERGGDLLCMPMEEACFQSAQAIQALAQAGRTAGARVVLLGSYQAHPRASAELV